MLDTDISVLFVTFCNSTFYTNFWSGVEEEFAQIFWWEAKEDTFPISHSWAWKEILKLDFNTFFAFNKSHLPSRGKHIWKTEILSRPRVWLEKNISVQRCENWRAAILSGEKVILNWKRVIFSGEKAILSSFLHYQNQQHLETGVYYIQVWSKLFWNRCNTRY